ncbi:TonB-dependent receptor [Sphingomonas koreensis]|nr:TonB-dependent receptor [Sphingomonas koreensis]
MVVTGSRIERPDLTSSSPVASLSAEQLKQNNSVTVEELLNSNPQFVPGESSASNNPANGVSTVDLRGLGSQRTLVLIDGKRAPSYDTQGRVDVNIIPTALIKRIDVLTGGASAVYGSDAVAGVVNFILDDRFTGLQADASTQITKYGDGAEYDLGLTGGVRLGDRGNLVLSGGYTKRDGVRYAARPRIDHPVDSSDLVTNAGSSNANPTIFDLPNGDELQVNPAGNLVPIYNLYNYDPVNYAQTPLNRYSAMALARYEITDGVEFFARGSYTHVKVSSTTAPTATAGYSFDISPDNPFLTADERAMFFPAGAGANADGTTTIGIRRRITESFGRVQNWTSNNWQIVSGLRGDFGGDYHWEVFGQYGETHRQQKLLHDLSYNAVSQAIDAVAGPNGPQCRDTSNDCIPLNVFTASVIPADSLAFILANGAVDNKITQLVTGADLSGDIGFLQSPLASHPAAFSIGGEYRRETGASIADANYASGDLIFYGQGQNITGHYDAKEIYTELKIPLVQERPLFYSLDLEGGFRYSDYSSVGNVYTYKGGGNWSPVEGVRFRGIYQRAVRAPNIYELYSPVVGGTGSLNNDPCAGANVSTAIAPICLAQGAPSVGNIPAPISGQINVFTGGNPDLKAEKSDTFTAGVVINPPSLRALSLTVDYYHIKISNAIDITPPQAVINDCFLISGDPTSDVCKSIHRNPLNGTLSGNLEYGVPQTLGNIAEKKTSGVDVALNYGGDVGGLRYGLSFAGTYTIDFTQKPSPLSPGIQCAGRFGSACNPLEPIPKWKHTFDVTLGTGQVNFITRWRYFGGVREDAATDILVSRVPAQNYFDETVSFDVDHRFDLRLGINNVFNKKAPILGDTVGNDMNSASTFPGVYDILGRTFFASVTSKF